MNIRRNWNRGSYSSSVAALGCALLFAPSAARAGEAAAGGAQVATGEKLFGSHCAKCHGAGGAGTKRAPAVVGKDALPLDPPSSAKVRKAQFRTARDVYDFISTKMPAKKPGSLKPEEYAAILAFDLKANGIDVANKQIDATTAAGITLHP